MKKYRVKWAAALYEVDDQEEIVEPAVSSYGKYVDFDNVKLIQKVCSLVGEQLFEQTVMDEKLV